MRSDQIDNNDIGFAFRCAGTEAQRIVFRYLSDDDLEIADRAFRTLSRIGADMLSKHRRHISTLLDERGRLRHYGLRLLPYADPNGLDAAHVLIKAVRSADEADRHVALSSLGSSRPWGWPTVIKYMLGEDEKLASVSIKALPRKANNAYFNKILINAYLSGLDSAFEEIVFESIERLRRQGRRAQESIPRLRKMLNAAPEGGMLFRKLRWTIKRMEERGPTRKR